MKRLVMNPQAPRGLMPAMLLRGESYDHLNTQPLASHVTQDGSNVAVYPGEYALRCDRKLIPIYQRFGFRLAHPEPLNGDYVMSLDRSTYVHFATKWFEKANESGWRIRFDPDTKVQSKSLEAEVQRFVRDERFKAKVCEGAFR